MRLFASILLATCSAAVAGATDVDLKMGIRSFGPDHERWPQVSVGVRFGPDAWRFRPELALARANGLAYGGAVTEASAGVGGDLPHRSHAAWSWGLGYARLRYEIGANQGEADASYGELALRWVRPVNADLGLALRYLDGADITFRYPGYPSLGDSSFSEAISTVVLAFQIRW